MNTEKVAPIYLVPFDKKYFLFGLSLLTNLKQYLDDFENVFVLNFGLTKNQLDFLYEFGVAVIPLPVELTGAHPYKLKSNLITFLRNRKLLDRWIVLLDADMLLLKSPVDEIGAVISQMKVGKNTVALCQDMGPAESISAFLKIFERRTLKFKKYVSELNISSPYLNIGFVIFSPQFNFYEFKYLADRMEGEMCWEQNAINLMCLEGSNCLILDAKIWNLHGAPLVDEYSDKDNPYIIHITSTPNNLVQGQLELMIDGVALTFFYRYIKNIKVLQIQRNFLEKLIAENGELLLKHFN
jgi:hypothetical protein